MKRTTTILVASLALLVAAGAALADGMIVPVRREVPVRGHWSVMHHHVKITVRDQVASVHIDQKFVNHGRQAMEVEYLFPIPPGAAIDSMTVVVDGKELTGRILEAKEARKIYEDIVRKKKDPALLEYMGFGLYRTRAFPLEPNKPAHVVVTYVDVCKKDGDLVEVMYPLNTEKYSAKRIESVKVTVDIRAKADITAVYSPTHDLDVKRTDARHVVASFAAKDSLPDTDFQVYYKAANEKIGATVLAHRPDKDKDGYFLVLVSPNATTASGHVASKDLVVVLDHSGSMAANEKLDQAKAALRQVLANLGAEDRFNIVSFSDSVDVLFEKGMVQAGQKNADEALEMIDRLEPTGGTDIAGALTAAMGLFDEADRPKYVVFLTDGVPTVGERNEGAIVKGSKEANKSKARLFALGVGYDVNVQLVDKLVRANRGVSDYVAPKEPLEAKVSRLYDKIKRPVMTNLAVSFEGIRATMTYPNELGDLFDGGQIVMVGRYDGGGKTKLTVTGTLEGKKQSFEYPVKLPKLSETSRNVFVERLWAVRRCGYLLDQIHLNGESKELTDELVALSKTYGIITPYTAFLADESVALGDDGEHRRLSRHEAKKLSEASTGYAGQSAGMTRSGFNYSNRAAAAPAAVPEARPAEGLSSDEVSDGRGVAQHGHGDKDLDKYEDGEQVQLANVQNVGNQTLYRRGQVWYAPGTEKLRLDNEDDLKKIQAIERFSKEYFELVKLNTTDENRVLASQRSDEELLVNLRGQVYHIK